MEELRQSIRIREEANIRAKEQLLFKSLKYPLNDFIDQQFISTIDDDSFIWTVLNNLHLIKTGFKTTIDEFKAKQLYNTITYEEYVNESISAIAYFHLHIVDSKLNQRIVKDAVQQLTEQINILETYKQIQFNQPNKLTLSYSKHRSLRTEISNYYKLKYKVAMNNQELKSIYPIGDDMQCYFPILPESNQLQFTIQGKSLNGGQNFETISKINLDLEEVLISFNIKNFSKEIIQPCRLTMNYNDESPNAPYIGDNVIEIMFQLSMPSDNRIVMMKNLKEKQQANLTFVDEQIASKDKLIKQLLVVYEDIIYITGTDLKNSKDINNRACECNIF